VACWTSEGKTVVYALATSGEAGIQGMAPAECGPLREAEEQRSAAVVGVASAIRRHRPQVVVTSNFELTWDGRYVNHADHRAVGLATLDACRDAANPWLFEAAGPAWDGAHDVYVAAAADPTHYVDVTGHLDRGVASLREHRAYIEGLGREFDPDAFLRGSAEASGREVGCPLAVTFRRYST
jgi:LmbE family N-acetylglucosaminyl deacetylase